MEIDILGMIRKIFKTGHSVAITITKKMLNQLGLKLGDKVSIEVDEDKARLVVRQAKSSAQLALGLKIRHHLGESAPRKEL